MSCEREARTTGNNRSIVCGWTYELGPGIVFGWAYELGLGIWGELGTGYVLWLGIYKVNLVISCGFVRYSGMANFFGGGSKGPQ